MNLVALILTLFVGLFILIGSVFGIYFKNNTKITDFSISVAFGVIIGLILFELIPESYEILSDEVGFIRGIFSLVILVLIGITFLKILDMFIPHHEHEAHHGHSHNSNKCHNEHLYHIGIVSSFAVIVHNIIEGMSLYLVSVNKFISGLLFCLGIGLHNIPMGLIISSTLISSNYSRTKTIKISLIVSISTFIGGLIMFFMGGANELINGILLGLTLGMLIYISIFELFHQIYHMKNKRLAITGIIVGLSLLIINVFLEHIMY